MKKIKVGIVNYLNTKPLLYGLTRLPVSREIEFVPDYPSNVARDLKNGTIDVGLVPVAILPTLNEWHIISDYCIGCDGPVASVCLFSETPLSGISNVLLDYQSRTSGQLARILIRDYWKMDVELIQTATEFRSSITGRSAGLVIGDRCLEQRSVSTYCYDLGEAWKIHTGMPFVFAAWVSNKILDDRFILAFNEANAYGLDRIEQVVAENEKNNGLFNMYDYYTRYISYTLDDRKKQGLGMFLELMKRGA